LQGVARIRCDRVGDLSRTGFATISKYSVSIYDWNGHLRDQFPASEQRIELAMDSWPLDLYAKTWISADALAYAKASMPERTAHNSGALVRFSPDGQSLGCALFLPDRLEVMVRGQGKTRWRRSLPITAAGPITGRQVIDLLISNDGRVLLYCPEPSPHPILVVADRSLTGKNLKQPFQTLVTDYRHALMLQQRLNPFPQLSGWARTVLAQTPDGHYALIETPVHSWSDKLIARSFAKSYAGRIRLSVLRQPDTTLLVMTAKYRSPDYYTLTSLPFDRESRFEAPLDYDQQFFSPDGSRLLVLDDMYSEMAIYRY